MRKQIATVALAAVAVAGCSSPTPTDVDHTPNDTASQATTSGTPNPCELVTSAEVSAAMRAPVSAEPPDRKGGLPGQVTCHFTQPDSTSSVSVAVWPADPTLFDQMKTQAGSVRDLPGLGDKAFGEPRAVYVLRGSLMVNVVIIGFDVSSTAEASSIARTATGRL
jgi:hypothetical protein